MIIAEQRLRQFIRKLIREGKGLEFCPKCGEPWYVGFSNVGPCENPRCSSNGGADEGTNMTSGKQLLRKFGVTSEEWAQFCDEQCYDTVDDETDPDSEMKWLSEKDGQLILDDAHGQLVWNPTTHQFDWS